MSLFDACTATKTSESKAKPKRTLKLKPKTKKSKQKESTPKAKSVYRETAPKSKKFNRWQKTPPLFYTTPVHIDLIPGEDQQVAYARMMLLCRAAYNEAVSIIRGVKKGKPIPTVYELHKLILRRSKKAQETDILSKIALLPTDVFRLAIHDVKLRTRGDVGVAYVASKTQLGFLLPRYHIDFDFDKKTIDVCGTGRITFDNRGLDFPNAPVESYRMLFSQDRGFMLQINFRTSKPDEMGPEIAEEELTAPVKK